MTATPRSAATQRPRRRKPRRRSRRSGLAEGPCHSIAEQRLGEKPCLTIPTASPGDVGLALESGRHAHATSWMAAHATTIQVVRPSCLRRHR